MTKVPGRGGKFGGELNRKKQQTRSGGGTSVGAVCLGAGKVQNSRRQSAQIRGGLARVKNLLIEVMVKGREKRRCRNNTTIPPSMLGQLQH